MIDFDLFGEGESARWRQPYDADKVGAHAYQSTRQTVHAIARNGPSQYFVAIFHSSPGNTPCQTRWSDPVSGEADPLGFVHPWRHAKKNMMRWKKERSGSSCLQWHRHTHAERERERDPPTPHSPTHTHSLREERRRRRTRRQALEQRANVAARPGVAATASRGAACPDSRGGEREWRRLPLCLSTR